MQKKKIVKLEIKKEDILNLSIDEAQKVIGGGDYTLNKANTECATEWCSKQGCDNETYPCDTTIVDSDLCGLSSICESGWCQTDHTQDDSSFGCART